jgi:ABC-2 type transport system permease protein
MNLWRMETLRLTRTGRWIPLAAVFGGFGILGPVSVRYQQALIRKFGGGNIRIFVPPPTPPDAIRAYLGNAE